MSQWWLSFADPHRPQGSQFLGVVIVEAEGDMEAFAKTNVLGVNPGGEIQYVPLPLPVDVTWENRLLTKEEAMSVKPL